MLSDINLNAIEFCVGVVSNNHTEFRVKIGRTRELCDSSKTLIFYKKSPYMFDCAYKSLAYFKIIILDTLYKNELKNFGDDELPEKAGRYFNHRFNLNCPTIPYTKL